MYYVPLDSIWVGFFQLLSIHPAMERRGLASILLCSNSVSEVAQLHTEIAGPCLGFLKSRKSKWERRRLNYRVVFTKEGGRTPR
jgi:hypothetical protein